MQLRAVWAAAVCLLLVVPAVSTAQKTPGQIQKELDRKNGLIGGHKAKERVLTTDISRQTGRINDLQADIDRLSLRQQKLQTSLNAKREELAAVQRRLRQERARLTRLKARLVVVRRALAQRLLDLYKAGEPDLVGVVLNADGFEDLLTRTEFMARISRQDAKIMKIVADAKQDATATEARLDKLEAKAAKVTKAIENQRDEVSTIRVGLVDRRGRIESARSAKTTLLASSRDRRHALEDDVASLHAAQKKVQAKLASFAGGPATAGPVKPGSGGLIWPVNGPVTSPFCESRSWESCHPGIDIGVPAGTPIRAAASGKVVLMQGTGSSGGYGNFTCIQHTASLSTCYAHQSRFATSVGASVKQGQVIGYVGCTGRCFGDHLHFETRINGSVVSPMNYL